MTEFALNMIKTLIWGNEYGKVFKVFKVKVVM